ncbi:MAG: endopeptidase La [Pirellulaceae bacterium]
MTEETTSTIRILPVLPLKREVLFPQQIIPLVVGREASMAAVEAALATEDKTLAVVPQLDETIEFPNLADLSEFGTVAVIKRMARTDQVLQLILQGIERVSIKPADIPAKYLNAEVTSVTTDESLTPETEALHREIIELGRSVLAAVNPQGEEALKHLVEQVESPLHQVYILSSMLSMKYEDEQKLLSAQSLSDAMELVHKFLVHESQVLEIRQKIASQAESEMSQEHREYLLRKQMRAIQEELGEKNPEQADVDELREQLAAIELPAEVRKEIDRELARLERLPAASPDYQVTRSYLELVAELPWNKQTEDQIDLQRARAILDADHFGLEKVKERIIEHLAVLKLNPHATAPILCFVGPPGVGKTSLGKSIASALGREFARESLGGLSDEAELRGHRRTYIGAMPGRIIQAVRRAGVRNPLLMLDEIDKLGRDFRGDPAAALLEILDPNQNSEFRDNYLNLPFDLSKVIFIATANSLDTIPRPLLDRIEILQVSGYSDLEKLNIAKTYLLPRQLQDKGLSDEQLILPDDALLHLIRQYTRESGVRELERVIGSVCRKAATHFAEGNQDVVHIDQAVLNKMLGRPRFREQDARTSLEPGVAAGMAWTPVGGEVLYVEAVLLPDSKEFSLTGQLGDVMKESARTAQSFVRSQWAELDLEKQALNCGVHIHVPAGATPKDGPSAGVTMATALASLYAHQPVRSDTAMTGEITLSGLVLPVGGIKEKVLAAHRAGMKQIILPKANEPDVEDLPESVRNELEFVFAITMEDVVAAAIPKLANKFVHA